MGLEKWAEGLAERLQEQATTLSHSDIRKSLSDCLNDDFPGQYAQVCDIYGDDESGDVVYQKGGEHLKAPYALGTANGKRAHSIDHDQAVNVLPRTVYDEEADEGDTVSGTESLREMHPDVARMLFFERFVSKSERAQADSGSFAGKGKSFPILKPGDVAAAAHALGRAGSDNYSTDVIKRNIIRIAKKKGWTSQLPKAWQSGDDSSESLREMELVESAAFPTDYVFTESNAVNPIVKIIDAGRGTSGYYSKEVLKRDGPEIFKAGTLMFINHATPAEEAARPEGDLNNLAAVTVGNAYWDENGKAGPALYAPAKVFSDHAAQVTEKAPYTGVSIRAGGKLNERKIAPDGKPGVIEALTRAASIDLVTKAGRGGKLLLEAQGAINLFEAANSRTSTQEADMDEAAVKALLETKIKEATAPLLAKIAEYEKPAIKPKKVIRRILESIRLPDPAKDEVVRNLKGAVPLTEAGAIDVAKLKPLVEAEAKRQAQLLERLGIGKVEGLGAAIIETKPEPVKPEEALKESESIFARLMGDNAAAKAAARGRMQRVA